jgi:hypothetical protein
MPDKHTVAQRYLAQVNNIISVGEAPVQTDHVSESGINYLRKALDSVYDALQDKAMLRRSTLALNVVGKERTASDFSDMASAITRMLQICTAVVLSQIDSIVVHAATARVMKSYIDGISARSGPLFEGSKLTRRPLALTAIQMARRAREIPTVSSSSRKLSRSCKTSPCAELCHAHAVEMHNVSDISPAVHRELLTVTLSVEGYTDLKNIVQRDRF